MNKLESGMKFGAKVLKILGLEGKSCYRIVIDIKIKDIVKVYAVTEHALTQGDELLDALLELKADEFVVMERKYD